jgi:hypothetical protein
MKKLFLLITFSFLVIQLNAQFKVIARSPSFEEPETGYAKILFMKNKNTVYIHVTPKDGIKLKVYDADHKQILTKVVNHKFGKLKGLNVEGCFEISKNITLLVSEYDERTPVLYRIVLDGQTGNLVSQEEIAKLSKITLGAAYAIQFGGVKMPDFIIRKDPASENYTVTTFNTFASERDRRIEVVHYNNEHKVVSKGYLSTPEDKYKYVNILDIAVMGDKEAYALIYGFNTARSGGKEGELFVANFKNNTENAEFISLSADAGQISTQGVLKYSKTDGKLYAVTQVQSEQKKKGFFGNDGKVYYDIGYHIIDPKAKSSVVGPEIDLSGINKKFKEIFGEKKNYSGVLQNFYLNEDGTYSFVFEGLTVTVTTRMSSSSSQTSVTYELGDIAVLNYNQKGVQTSCALVPKSQMLNNSIMSGGVGVTAEPLYHYTRDFTAQLLGGGNQFKSFAYLNGKNKNYILINDIEENAEKIQKGKLTQIKGVGECDGFAFETSTANVLPSRSFVFGKADGKKDHNLAVFTISDFDRESNVYATLKLEVDGRDRSVKVVWMQAE